MINQNRIMKGSSGYVWLNGKLLAHIKSIEAKITGNFEEVSVAGEFTTHNVYIGWSGEGSMVLQKIDSTSINLLATAFKSGVMPDIKIVTKLEDRSTGKAERVAIENIVFTEFMLTKFASKELIEEELPFKFSNYEILEAIA